MATITAKHALYTLREAGLLLSFKMKKTKSIAGPFTYFQIESGDLRIQCKTEESGATRLYVTATCTATGIEAARVIRDGKSIYSFKTNWFWGGPNNSTFSFRVSPFNGPKTRV